MTEPNPYEPPRVNEPLRRQQITKRIIGAATIASFTPVAVGIAFLASCGVSLATMNVVSEIGSQSFRLTVVSGLVTFLVPPLLTWIAMIWWARSK